MTLFLMILAEQNIVISHLVVLLWSLRQVWAADMSEHLFCKGSLMNYSGKKTGEPSVRNYNNGNQMW